MIGRDRGEPMRVTVRIQRRDADDLVIEDADWLADAFFSLDPSSQKDGYDDWIASPEQRPDRITLSDIRAINSTMRARSSPKVWNSVIGQPGSWLANVNDSWHLFEISDERWRTDVAPALAECIQHLRGRGRGVSVATKVLHIKRPHLIPVCDSLVVEQLAYPMPTSGESAVQVIGHLRLEGRRQLKELEAVQAHLQRVGLSRSLVRILDGLLWASHPATRMYPAIAMIKRWRHSA